MKFDGFYGNARSKEYLKSAMERGALPHAFLLSGPEGTGKRTLAGILARALVCQGEGEKPCGVCPACVKSQKECHPDIAQVMSDGSSIKVETIRALKQDAYLRPNDGARKVYVIHDADVMTQEAQDALLKILEEPPAFTVFLLLCYNYGSILPTVISRCIHLPLAPLTRAEAEPLLAARFPDADAAARDALYDASGGILGPILSTEAQEKQGADKERAEAMIAAAAAGDALGILEYMISIEKIKRQELADVLDQAAVYLRDALVQATGGAPLLHREAEASTRALAARAGSAGVLRAAEAVRRARTYCAQNIGVAHITGVLACELAQAVRT